jgi:hypothetical protein
MLFILVAACGTSFAATYYVATNGNDTWPGTSAQPWATVQYAVQTIAAGDTIIVKPGTYAGARIEFSGSAGAPKTLMAETVGAVTLNALSSQARHSGIIEIENYDAAVSYWAIDGFVIDGMNHLYRPIDSRSTYDKPNSHITISDNAVQHAYATGISSGQTHYALIENNTSHSNNEHGTYVNNSSDYGVLRLNVISSPMGCGMHHNGDKSLGGDGIMSFWVVEKNIIYGAGTNGGAALNFDGVQDTKVLNNLAYDNTAGGVTLFYTDGSSNCQRDLVYNNTLVFTGAVGRWVVSIPKSGKIAPIGNKIKNNILYIERTDRGAIFTYMSGISGFESDYNAVVDRFCIDGRRTISLATWRTYGYDTHSFLSTPAALFVDPANDNYHLKVGSPAINAGTTLTEVVDDLEGRARPQGGVYDIGCYEY